jgi:succinate dehydrogenase/fumarate reductase flavoprotein subunit
MIGYVEAPRAWGLTRGMARLAGFNLAHAVVEGWLTRRELADLVERCQACDRSEACTAWLAEPSRDQSPPVFCPNKARLEALS